MSAVGSSCLRLPPNIGRLGIVSVQNADFAAALTIYIPQGIQPIHINGSKSTFYIFRLPDELQIDLAYPHIPFLSAGKGNGRFWLGGGCEILLRVIFSQGDYSQIFASAPQLSTVQFEALCKLFNAPSYTTNWRSQDVANSA